VQELLATLKARNAELEGAERQLNEARVKQEETAREMEAARLEAGNAKEQLEGAWKMAEGETHRAQQLETEVSGWHSVEGCWGQGEPRDAWDGGGQFVCFEPLAYQFCNIVVASPETYPTPLARVGSGPNVSAAGAGC
jgi:hypothetical protein